jgi:hypothetical protein
MVSVNKGMWDKSKGPDLDHEFNRARLAAMGHILSPLRNLHLPVFSLIIVL